MAAISSNQKLIKGSHQFIKVSNLKKKPTHILPIGQVNVFQSKYRTQVIKVSYTTLRYFLNSIEIDSFFEVTKIK